MSGKVGTDPSRPLDLCLDFRSVHAVAFRIRYRKPDDDEPTVVVVGTHKDDEKCHELPELPWGSVIEYRFLYADEDDAEFEVEISIQQDGEDVDCSPLTVIGGGGEFGVEGEIEVVDDCEEED